MGCTGSVLKQHNFKRRVGPTPQILNTEQTNGDDIETNTDLPATRIATNCQLISCKSPIMIYAANPIFMNGLKMTGELSEYIEYQPDNVLEVETKMRDYIDLLVNPHSNKPKEIKIEILKD